jgi:hypothetical protein
MNSTDSTDGTENAMPPTPGTPTEQSDSGLWSDLAGLLVERVEALACQLDAPATRDEHNGGQAVPQSVGWSG